ncbi:tRNA lysidine(34) synthetase TilS [Prauserella halophila]|uniref:tRNA(Ile)-lysidine synthase n=1 Tax=Prauserella halophila TaxID=185641 RepID=A0ABP4GTN3_9PSEU|nr:tRNA lysidine(34) synthetase TilS [Prauserella halophila]MCP2235491.1 tRNA(Ile)-lysidine synthase [Prauserella halophila]
MDPAGSLTASGRSGFHAVAAVRKAVREFLAAMPEPVPASLCVAVSGGADSLALAEAAAYTCRSLPVTALVVDHGLQAGSDEVAEKAAATARDLGAGAARVLPVSVSGPGGPEAAARRARYTALREASGGAPVLLGHTRDDQAETVLLGLGRGSGPRSIAGMRPHDPPWARPLLGLPRATTRDACDELGITPWQDPHNADSRYRRVRIRDEALPMLEDVLGGGVAGALARTAAQLRDDVDVLDDLAEELLGRALADAYPDAGGESEGMSELSVASLGAAPAALRRRALRSWLLGAGVRELTDAHLRSVDALVADWRGQGGVWLPGDFEAGRARGKLRVRPAGAGTSTTPDHR